MNGMNFKPFISKVLSSLSEEDLGSFASLIDTHSNSFTNRSLLDSTNLIKTADKGVGLFTIQLDQNTIRSGYLVYNNSYCVLLSYVSNSDRVTEYNINLGTMTYEVVKEFLTTDYLRHEVAIRATGAGLSGEVVDLSSNQTITGKKIFSNIGVNNGIVLKGQQTTINTGDNKMIDASELYHVHQSAPIAGAPNMEDDDRLHIKFSIADDVDHFFYILTGEDFFGFLGIGQDGEGRGCMSMPVGTSGGSMVARFRVVKDSTGYDFTFDSEYSASLDNVIHNFGTWYLIRIG